MKIFKNEVGRPSKEKVATRRMYMATFIVSCFAIVLSIIAILNSNFNFIKLSGAAANTCKFPYTYKKCNGKANDTVKKVQELLKNKICTSKGKKVACYSDKTDGKFGSKTKTAVTNFQKAQGITQDGNLGYDTLTRLAKVTKTRYFVIEYDKAGSSTALSGTQTLTSKSKKKYVQAFIYGVTSQISDTKLKKSGYEHVGYTIESTYNGITYRYGCFDKNCKTGNWYDSETIQKNKEAGKEFYSNVYSIGTKVSKTGQLGDGQVVKFTAKYCKSGEEYDKTKSECVKKKATTTKAASGKDGITTVVSQQYIDSLSKVDLSKYYGGSTFQQTYYHGYRVGTGYTTSSSKIKYDSKNKWYTYNGSIVVATATTNYGKHGEKKNIYYFTYKSNDTLYMKINNIWYKAIVLDSCGACTKVTKYKKTKQVIDIWTEEGSGLKNHNVQVVIPK